MSLVSLLMVFLLLFVLVDVSVMPQKEESTRARRIKVLFPFASRSKIVILCV